eukprot:3444436-Amphidinium_carterae.1
MGMESHWISVKKPHGIRRLMERSPREKSRHPHLHAKACQHIWNCGTNYKEECGFLVRHLLLEGHALCRGHPGVPLLELMEVMVVNSVAPFLLTSKLLPGLKAGAAATIGGSYVVNVTAQDAPASRGKDG